MIKKSTNISHQVKLNLLSEKQREALDLALNSIINNQMDCENFKYTTPTVNMNVIENFDGTINEQYILYSILSE